MRIFVTVFLLFAASVLAKAAYTDRSDRYKLIGNLFASIMMLVAGVYAWI